MLPRCLKPGRLIAPRVLPVSARPLSLSARRAESITPAPTSGKAASVAPTPTELLTVIQETIKTHGPLPVSRYMTLCLAHPTLGYYTTRRVFGSTGDFVTSPEISQIFGELLGIWFVTQWASQGLAKRVRIVELGPGKGTLLTDILRTFKALPAAASPPITTIHLIESSDALREVQRQKLASSGFGGIETKWWGSVDEVPHVEDEFTIVLAHEFFDALPIHVFENTSRGWREVMVDIADPKKDIIVSSTPKLPLRLVLAPTPTPASTLYTRLSSLAAPPAPGPVSLSFDTTLPLPTPQQTPAQSMSPTLSRFDRLPEGSRMEISPASWEVVRALGKLVSANTVGGAGLIVDYGDGKGFGRSWRGFRKHQIVDPLSEPGHTDLTANVDFSYLAEAISDVATSHGPLPQSDFLNSLGLLARLRGLLAKAPEARKGEIESAAKRLVDGLGMGKEYKVMAITPRKEGSVEECFPFPLATGMK